MEHIVFGILAHVDSGKTTLSEALLFLSGAIKKAGRVDKGDTCLDNYALERTRGITIFSKQAEFEACGKGFTLLDTPGHIDFSAEMERTLSVLDYTVLVISATGGIESHTRTLWNLLKRYEIPTFIFVNKMDSFVGEEKDIEELIKQELGGGIVKLTENPDEAEKNELEEIAVCDENLLEEFLETGKLKKESIKKAIKERKIFPCFFGSALKLDGTEEFLKGFAEYTDMPEYGKEFGARVFKIARDENDNRLAYIKITGGELMPKTKIGDEKIQQIRVYSGEKYELKEKAGAGEVCAVTGLLKPMAGDGLGFLEGKNIKPVLEQVMSYRVILDENVPPVSAFLKLKELSEEIPELGVKYSKESKEISVSLMGEVQIEIITSLIRDKYGFDVSFGEGSILYKETIIEPIEGVGHFEPLGHYAEVHLRLEPAERGSGISIGSELSEDALAANWQKLIFSHVAEKQHKGVLTGSPVTDIKITLTSGRAHLKHTEGGDFRQAVYRAIRHGLMRAKSALLEPIYEFNLEIPKDAVGRAMTDISAMKGKFEAPEINGDKVFLTGRLPANELKDYRLVLRSYTGGEGSMELSFAGYDFCHNQEEIIEKTGYYPEADMENTADSVFCSHGAGFVVPWDSVSEYMHLPYSLREGQEENENEKFLRYATEVERQTGREREEIFLGTEEIDSILGQAVSSNKKKEAETARNRWKRYKAKRDEGGASSYEVWKEKKTAGGEEFLLVDGYNIIFAWKDLRELAEVNIDSARDKLIEVLVNYQGYKACRLLLVFDAYRVKGGRESIVKYAGIDVIYTKEAETADEYIAKTGKKLASEGRVTVATSDSLVQMIIFGSGAIRMSANELENEVRYTEEKIRESGRVI